jgi:hypothetical protein
MTFMEMPFFRSARQYPVKSFHVPLDSGSPSRGATVVLSPITSSVTP